jgi:hypothetical protein
MTYLVYNDLSYFDLNFHKKAYENIIIELVKKTKKQEPKIFPWLMLVDKEAFEDCG